MKDSNKELRLLDSAFELFTKKGFKNTSIQDIVDNSKVAKGTFYTYFKDKYELRDILIAKKSNTLFQSALKKLKKKKDIINLEDQVVFIINDIIDKLRKDKVLLTFISKNLSWGLYNKAINSAYQLNNEMENGIREYFIKAIENQNIKLENPDVTLYMIIELVSSTCFNSISLNEPLPIEEFKPYLYKVIRTLLHENKTKKQN